LACTQDFLLIHRRELVVVDERLSVANNGSGAASCAIENKIADQVEPGRGYPLVTAQIPQDEISSFSNFDTADHSLTLQCHCAIDCRHVQHHSFRGPRGNLK